MKVRLISFVIALLLFGMISGVAAQSGGGAIVYALTSGNAIVTFDSAAPGSTLNSAAVTGLGAGEQLVGIDVRPATGQLFALSDASRLYVVEPNSGAAVAVGGGFTPVLDGSAFGFDFNPTVDRIRLTSSSAQNLRLNPNTGGVAATDTALAFNSADSNAGATPNIVASAYTNNFPDGGSTTLYNIDATRNILVTQIPPNNGVLNTVGALGVDAGRNTGFDIVGTNLAFASFGSSFYSVNLSTGRASFVGTIGGGAVIDIAISTSPTVQGAGAGVSCGVLSASGSPVARISAGDASCRLLVQNGRFINPPEQIGAQNLIDAGVKQAVDIFDPSGTGTAAGAQVCLQGSGRLVFLDASTAPRAQSDLGASFNGVYSCGFIPGSGTVVLING